MRARLSNGTRFVSRSAKDRLRDIIEACEKIIRNTAGTPRDIVFADELRLDGILLNLHVIGEAVKGLPGGLRDAHPEIPWRRIAGMRDFIAHAYFAVDLDIIWDTVTVDVPALRAQVAGILEPPDAT